MNKEIFENAKKELPFLGVIFLLLLLAFKIVFFREGMLLIIRVSLSLFWMLVLPGYFIMLYWADNLDFLERIIVGVAACAAMTGIFSYYLGLIGIGIKYHAVILPLFIVVAGAAVNMRR